jgi:hypothetical protein
MQIKNALMCALVLLLLFHAGWAEAKSCTSEIAKEVFKYFGENEPNAASCEDYVYRLTDLNGDGRDEIIIYRKQYSCDAKGKCDSEIFMRQDGKFKNFGTLPGSYQLLETKTDGFVDISVQISSGQIVKYKWIVRRYEPDTYAVKKPNTPSPIADDPWNALP